MTGRKVIWIPNAENELTDLWMAANDRIEITQAVYALDMALKNRGVEVGTELSEGLFAIEIHRFERCLKSIQRIRWFVSSKSNKCNF